MSSDMDALLDGSRSGVAALGRDFLFNVIIH